MSLKATETIFEILLPYTNPFNKYWLPCMNTLNPRLLRFSRAGLIWKLREWGHTVWFYGYLRINHSVLCVLIFGDQFTAQRLPPAIFFHSVSRLPDISFFVWSQYYCTFHSKKWKDINPHIRSLRITLSSFSDAEHGDHSQRALLVVGRNVISGTITSGTGLPWCNPQLSRRNST